MFELWIKIQYSKFFKTLWCHEESYFTIGDSMSHPVLTNNLFFKGKKLRAMYKYMEK